MEHTSDIRASGPNGSHVTDRFVAIIYMYSVYITVLLSVRFVKQYTQDCSTTDMSDFLFAISETSN